MRLLFSIQHIRFWHNKVSVLFGLFFLFFPFISQAAWQEPTGEPPTQNVSSPLNVSSQGQAKLGGLTVGSAALGSFTLFSAGTLGVQGAATLQSTLDVQQAATFQNIINVKGAADFDSLVNVDGQFDARGGIRAYDAADTRFWVDNASDKVLINTTVTTPGSALIVNGGTLDGAYISSSSGNALEVVSSNPQYPTIDATHTASSGISGVRSVAVLGRGADIFDPGNGSSYGVYGQAGDQLAGRIIGDRVTYGVYGQAGDVSEGVSKSVVSYGVYGKAGVSGEALSYAGYFEGEVQVCGRGEGCASIGTKEHSAVFSQDSVYFSSQSPLSGGITIDSTIPGRRNEKRVIRVDGGLYLSWNGTDRYNQYPSTLLMHDRERPDNVYRIEVVNSFLTATMVAACVPGLYCDDLNTVVRREENNRKTGCVNVPDTEVDCDQNGDAPRCLNGKCVTRCEYAGFFCGRPGTASCGTVSSESCGSNNGLVCCTGT